MRDIELYRAILGVTAPWTVVSVDLDVKGQQDTTARTRVAWNHGGDRFTISTENGIDSRVKVKSYPAGSGEGRPDVKWLNRA